MKRKFFLLLPGIIFLQLQTIAQVQITSIDRIINGTAYYSFPFVKFTDITVADKINAYLQSEMLQNDIPLTDTATIFENSRYKDEDSVHESGYLGIGYTIGDNTPTILSVFFAIEGMGAYPSYSSSYYNFDGRTGELLTIKHLLTPTGIEIVKRRLIKEREKLISLWKTELKKQGDIGPDELSSINEAFKTCNEDATAGNFFIKKDSILFYKEPCLPHAASPFETNLDIHISFKELEKYMSEAGLKRLYSNKRRGRLDDLRDDFYD